MSWGALIMEFLSGLFSGTKAVKVAKAAGELEAGKREVAAVDADVAAIKGELVERMVLLPGPTTPPQPSPAPVAPTQPAPATSSHHITD